MVKLLRESYEGASHLYEARCALVIDEPVLIMARVSRPEPLAVRHRSQVQLIGIDFRARALRKEKPPREIVRWSRPKLRCRGYKKGKNKSELPKRSMAVIIIFFLRLVCLYILLYSIPFCSSYTVLFSLTPSFHTTLALMYKPLDRFPYQN